MVNRQRKILKYIYKHPRSTHSTIIREFPDFMEYKDASIEYLIISNEYIDPEKAQEDKLLQEASKLRISIPETYKYVEEHMPKDKLVSVPDPSDHKFYSTNLKFQEYLEKRRHEAFRFWIPYGLTTLIAALSVIFEILNFIHGN